MHGQQRWESCRTLDEARRAKSARHTDIGRGEFETRSRVTLHEYLREWIERYQGTGRRGYRAETREEDRRLLERFALRYFPKRLRLGEVTPSMVAGFVAWLCDPQKQQGRTLADRSVRNALKPLRSALATARREGLIRHNPATEIALPHRERVEDEDDLPRPFPRIEQDGETVETMELVVSLIGHHRPMFELLASTGVRRSELLAFEVRHIKVNGDRPCVQVRQRLRRQRRNGLVVGPLKSRHARRDIPIPLDLADGYGPMWRARANVILCSRRR